jgi:hypothetical protein
VFVSRASTAASIAVSIRLTKKLATLATDDGSPPRATSASSPPM